MPRRVGVVSLELDLHAHAVAKRLRERFSCPSHVFAIDCAHQSGKVSIGLGRTARLRDYDGVDVDLADLEVLWWRRANQPQIRSERIADDTTFDFVSNEWRFAFQTVFYGDFDGVWVNDPQADARATCKNVQLRKAKDIGFRVPATLISNDREEVLRFCEALDFDIVAKKIAGTALRPLATARIDKKLLQDSDVELCPAVYQERIDPGEHLRIMVFGDAVHVVSISGETMDWRRNLNANMAVTRDYDHMRDALIAYVKALGLKMGVLDFVVSEHGDVYFLEINPQGQFLFAEQRAKVDLTEAAASFLSRVM